MKKCLLTLLLVFSFVTPAFGEYWGWYLEYGENSEVNRGNLNGNFRNGMTVVNGGLDNENLKDGFRLIEEVTSLPLPAIPGRVVYLTTENVLYLDDGSTWFGTPTYEGTPVQGEVLHFNGTNWSRLGVGAAGNTLRSGGAGADVSWAALNLAGGAGIISGILPVTNGGTGLTAGDFSRTAGGSLRGTYPDPTIGVSQIPKVLFTWSGVDTATANTYGMFSASTQTGNPAADLTNPYLYLVTEGTTYRTMLNFKFKKVAEIDTVVIHARLWSNSAVATHEAQLRVNIGGQTGQHKSTTTTTPAWGTSYGGNIDVSGLTDGTVYDGIVELAGESASNEVYCGAVTIIGYAN